jgi:hypothetical protein
MMKESLCVCCGEPIPAARLKAVPGTTTCVRCATVPRKNGFALSGDALVQHTGGLHEKYLHEEDAEMDRKTRTEEDQE